MIFNAHNSYIYYNENLGIVNDYYQMIVDILKNIIMDATIKINIVLGDDVYNFENNNRSIRIAINYEHTLVKKGGRDSQYSPIGNVIDSDNNKYLVRIVNITRLNSSDIIIDYSIPNIFNVKTSGTFTSLSNKHIYIYPSLYNIYTCKENRNVNTLTTFINTQEPRRKKLLENISDHTNISNCFNKDKLRDIYIHTKILINIHQTNEHHTFEELRVLPALQCGVIVISENSPLNNLVPYNDYIIWSSYDEILNKVREVLDNYDYYHDLIFKDETRLKLDSLNKINYTTVYDKIIALTHTS